MFPLKNTYSSILWSSNKCIFQSKENELVQKLLKQDKRKRTLNTTDMMRVICMIILVKARTRMRYIIENTRPAAVTKRRRNAVCRLSVVRVPVLDPFFPPPTPPPKPPSCIQLRRTMPLIAANPRNLIKCPGLSRPIWLNWIIHDSPARQIKSRKKHHLPSSS